MKTLTYAETTNPDFTGFNFYVEEGDLFDFNDFIEAYDLDPNDFDPQEIKAVSDAAGSLRPGEWLQVGFE